MSDKDKIKLDLTVCGMACSKIVDGQVKHVPLEVLAALDILKRIRDKEISASLSGIEYLPQWAVERAKEILRNDKNNKD